jgi:hypothetical protein
MNAKLDKNFLKTPTEGYSGRIAAAHEATALLGGSSEQIADCALPA